MEYLLKCEGEIVDKEVVKRWFNFKTLEEVDDYIYKKNDYFKMNGLKVKIIHLEDPKDRQKKYKTEILEYWDKPDQRNRTYKHEGKFYSAVKLAQKIGISQSRFYIITRNAKKLTINGDLIEIMPKQGNLNYYIYDGEILHIDPVVKNLSIKSGINVKTIHKEINRIPTGFTKNWVITDFNPIGREKELGRNALFYRGRWWFGDLKFMSEKLGINHQTLSTKMRKFKMYETESFILYKNV